MKQIKNIFTDSQIIKRLTSLAKENISNIELERAIEKAPFLKEQIDNFLTIINLIKDSVNKKIDIDKKTLAIFIGAVLYVLMPIDIIPDFIPMVGWIDDIAVVGWIVKNFSSIITGYYSSKTLIDTTINNIIESKTTEWVEQINQKIKHAYKSLGFQLIIEILILSSFCIIQYYYRTFPARILIYTYTIGRISFSIINNSISIVKTLNQVAFFQVSQFFTYLKDTKNLQQAFMLDLKNIYQYHYDISTNSAFKITHKIGNIIKLTPDNEAIFNKLYKQISHQIHDILKQKIIIFSCFIAIYIFFIYTIRQIALSFA